MDPRSDAVYKLVRAPKGGADGSDDPAPDAILLLANMLALVGVVMKMEIASLGALFLALSAFARRGPDFDVKSVTMAAMFALTGIFSTAMGEAARQSMPGPAAPAAAAPPGGAS